MRKNNSTIAHELKTQGFEYSERDIESIQHFIALKKLFQNHLPYVPLGMPMPYFEVLYNKTAKKWSIKAATFSMVI